MMRERLLLLGKLLSPLPVADDGASSLLILGPNMIDHYPLLLSLLPGWNLNFSLEAITSLFIGINLTLFRFVSLFKVKKKTRRNSFQVRFFIQSKKKKQEEEVSSGKYLRWQFSSQIRARLVQEFFIKLFFKSYKE
jgi:hypothetical protein